MKILAFAREAGGAEAIAPVLQLLLETANELLICGKDFGLNIFEKHHLKTIELPSGDDQSLQKILGNYWEGRPPDMIFTSATSLPQLDMTEKHLWKWGERNGVLSVAVLDQWQNYAMRFSGTNPVEKLKYLPTVCCVMDDLAKEGMIREGFPPDRISVTGQPAFDSLSTELSSFNEKKNKKFVRNWESNLTGPRSCLWTRY